MVGVTLHWMQMFIIQIPKFHGELNFQLAHVMLMNVYHLETYPDFTKWVDSKGASNQNGMRTLLMKNYKILVVQIISQYVIEIFYTNLNPSFSRGFLCIRKNNL